MRHAKTLFIALMSALMLTAPVKGLTLQSVEPVDEPTALSASEDASSELYAAPPVYDETRGHLVYFQDFSGEEAAFENLVDATSNASSTATMGGSACVRVGSVKYSPNPVGIELYAADGSSWKYTDGSPVVGQLSVYAELYLDSDTKPQIFTTAYPGKDWGSYHTPWDNQSGKLTPKTWVSLYSKALSASTYSTIGLTTDNWHPLYVRSVGLYVKLSDENFYLASSAEGENKTSFAIADNMSYTFPAEFNGVSAAYWTTGSEAYAAGKTVNALALGGKTFYPLESAAVASVPDSYSENYGQLIYFNNFADKPVSYINAALKDLSNPQIKNGRWSMKTARDSISAGFEIISAAGSDGILTYNDGDSTPIYGNVVLRAEVYSDHSTSFNVFDTFRGTGLPGADWGPYKTFWTGAGGIGGATPSDWKTATSTGSFWVNPGNSLLGVGFRASAWDPSAYYISSIQLYVKSPTNALWLTDKNGENREFIVASEAYTFPAEFNGVSVSYWTDGTDLYEAGTTVGIADLADKTFSPTLENQTIEPKNTDEYSIRLGAIRGMRMTSFVNAVQRGLADEYGFIVALADSFADNDYSTLLFPEDMKGATALAEGETGKGTLSTGTKFVYATAYDKAAGTDIHKVGTFGDEDGFLINAVIINISAENYRTQYVTRPYLRVGDNYFYGEVMVKSIKDVAEVISLDDAYMDSLSEEDWNYINDIIGA